MRTRGDLLLAQISGSAIWLASSPKTTLHTESLRRPLRSFSSANKKISYFSAFQLISLTRSERNLSAVYDSLLVRAFVRILRLIPEIRSFLRAVRVIGVKICLGDLAFPLRNFDFCAWRHGASEIKIIAIFVLRVILPHRHCSVSAWTFYSVINRLHVPILICFCVNVFTDFPTPTVRATTMFSKFRKAHRMIK